MNSTYLFFMCLSYFSVILYIFFRYNSDSHKSISNIVFNDIFVCFGMLLMAFATILYEHRRNNYLSKYCIWILLLSIFFVIFTDNHSLLHICFGLFSFISILIFMFFEFKQHFLLLLSFFIQILFTFLFFYFYIFNYYSYILFLQCSLLTNFAIFYLFLHLF